jgi:hypothetical protein
LQEETSQQYTGKKQGGSMPRGGPGGPGGGSRRGGFGGPGFNTNVPAAGG